MFRSSRVYPPSSRARDQMGSAHAPGTVRRQLSFAAGLEMDQIWLLSLPFRMLCEDNVHCSVALLSAGCARGRSEQHLTLETVCNNQKPVKHFRPFSCGCNNLKQHATRGNNPALTFSRKPHSQRKTKLRSAGAGPGVAEDVGCFCAEASGRSQLISRLLDAASRFREGISAERRLQNSAETRHSTVFAPLRCRGSASCGFVCVPART